MQRQNKNMSSMDFAQSVPKLAETNPRPNFSGNYSQQQFFNDKLNTGLNIKLSYGNKGKELTIPIDPE